MPDRQPSLFGDEPAPWEAPDQQEHLVATVVFPKGPAGTYDYLVPAALVGKVSSGQRVRVPLGRGNRLVTGYCVQIETKRGGPRKLKALDSLVDPRSLLPASMVRLTRWLADYCLCDWGQVLDAVVPAGVRGQAGTRVVTLLSIAPDVLARLPGLKLSTKQRAILETLAGAERPMTAQELARAAKCTLGPIALLRRKGLIEGKTGRAQRCVPTAPPVPRQEPHALHADQQAALDAILEPLRARRHQTILIHGVTDSGKTEVYIRAIGEAVALGRQAIVLVPEISLTPQTLERFRARFDQVAVLHSHLSDAERHWQWQRIAEGRVQVIVGARSAVFAPVPRLGLIVLDEEHETTFKQDSVPRYHAREVALQRAQSEGVPLVLGSATPSLESWYRAQTGQYRLVEMPRRVLGRPLPSVGTIDLRTEQARSRSGAISRALHRAIHEALADGGQVILLLNRRGYATHIQCPACGQVLRCPHCEIALTHHRTEEVALCHYCNYEQPTPSRCPHCQFAGIRYMGLGTQRLEAEVRARFPGVGVVRMDTDTMQAPGAHERALAAFRSGEVRILLGTQMIAKGLDFPNVTLVGVINADTALHLPDFRAGERTFQLVTQVAGRTGRGDQGGRVLVQTFSPDHPAILAATRHDYQTFARGELPVRKMLAYPPFGQMIRLVVRSAREPLAAEFARQLGARLRACLEQLQAPARVLGPAPAPFHKLRGQFRFQIQLQGPDGEALRTAVRQATADLATPEEVQWMVDVDPVDMM